MTPDPKKDDEEPKVETPTKAELEQLEERLTYSEGDLILEYDPADEDDSADADK